MLQAVTALRCHCQRANMLQNPCKMSFKKNMVYKIPPGGGKPCLASGLIFRTNLGKSGINQAIRCKQALILLIIFAQKMSSAYCYLYVPIQMHIMKTNA